MQSSARKEKATNIRRTDFFLIENEETEKNGI